MSMCPIKKNVGEYERLGCLVAGGWLFLKGVASRRASRTILGGLLIYRGLSGNCKAYEVLGLDTRSDLERGDF